MAVLMKQPALLVGAAGCSSTTITKGSTGLGLGSIESYEILDKVGAGAFGVVSTAIHRDTGDLVAIKAAHESGHDEALLREAGLLALCGGNPAVVDLREVACCSETNRLYLVMDFVGRSLSDVLQKRRVFSETDTRRVMRQLLGGTEMMHRQNVIHRDLKPLNILIAGDGRVKICDLGLGKAIERPPPYTQLRGTVWYMSPELLLGENDYGAAVDLWSLGCVMGELLAGKPLFDETNEYMQICNIAKKLGVPADVSGLPCYPMAQSQLRQMVPEELLSREGFDVLRGLLEFEASKRLTAAMALQMPWFAMEDAPEATK